MLWAVLWAGCPRSHGRTEARLQSAGEGQAGGRTLLSVLPPPMLRVWAFTSVIQHTYTYTSSDARLTPSERLSFESAYALWPLLRFLLFFLSLDRFPRDALLPPPPCLQRAVASSVTNSKARRAPALGAEAHYSHRIAAAVTVGRVVQQALQLLKVYAGLGEVALALQRSGVTHATSTHATQGEEAEHADSAARSRAPGMPSRAC